MLDGWARARFDPFLDRLGGRLAGAGLSANAVTIVTCIIGLVGAAAIAGRLYILGMFLVLLSRLGDGLDGVVARIKGKTDLGGYIDIVLDFVFYGAIPLGFVIAEPQANAVAGAVLIFSFYINGASFLAYAILAEKRKMETAVRAERDARVVEVLARPGEQVDAKDLLLILE